MRSRDARQQTRQGRLTEGVVEKEDAGAIGNGDVGGIPVDELDGTAPMSVLAASGEIMLSGRVQRRIMLDADDPAELMACG
jgi:hypothetical protein